VKTFSSISLINNERTPSKSANPRRRAKIKEFRSIATRYDKTAESFEANINLAAAVIAAR
jgi:transposase